MTVALGTSTPTSITVVATRQSIRPARKRSITCSRVWRLSRPCSAARCRPASGPASSSLSTLRTPARSRSLAPESSQPSIVGTTTYACSPASSRSRTRAYAPARPSGATTRVSIGVRPGGGSSIVEMSRSPKSVIPNVRGMGVAVMTTTCGVLGSAVPAPRLSGPPLTRSIARWCTPKRCCSSITATARLWKRTLSVSSACVPTSTSISPASRPASSPSRSGPVTAPVRSATRTFDPSSVRESEPKCCSARISVGAMRAAWCPEATASSIA